MHSPALALGWELWARHRWGLGVLGAGAVIAAVLAQVLPAGATLAVGEVTRALTIFAYLYLLSVFVYAEGTLGGKAAGLPPRLFTLPVRTSRLVAWPMLYGMAAAALLWLWVDWLVLVPCGRGHFLHGWWALLLAAHLAWTQAVCWTLARTPLLRLVVAIAVLPSVVMVAVLVWAHYNVQITFLQFNLGLVALIGIAYVLAVAGVARDRRGDGWGWAWLGRLVLRVLPRLPAQGGAFASPLAAQRWLEVRQGAWLLPAFVGLFMALLFWATALPLGPAEVACVAVALVGFPCVLAFLTGYGMGQRSFWARDLHMSSFQAARPLTCAALADAKLHAAGLGALGTWALLLLLAPLWAVVTGNVEVVRALAESLLYDQPAWKLGLLLPLALAGLAGLTWLQIVGGMCPSLTGRAAVVNGVVLFYVAVGTALTALGLWTANHPDFQDTLLLVLWCLAGALGLLKLGAAAWICSRLGRWQDRRAALLLLWLAVAACLLLPLYALAPEGPGRVHLIALFLVLALPLNRLLALPAAVAWNRHR
jgi:hypothetical protein